MEKVNKLIKNERILHKKWKSLLKYFRVRVRKNKELFKNKILKK